MTNQSLALLGIAVTAYLALVAGAWKIRRARGEVYQTLRSPIAMRQAEYSNEAISAIEDVASTASELSSPLTSVDPKIFEGPIQRFQRAMDARKRLGRRFRMLLRAMQYVLYPLLLFLVVSPVSVIVLSDLWQPPPALEYLFHAVSLVSFVVSGAAYVASVVLDSTLNSIYEQLDDEELIP